MKKLIILLLCGLIFCGCTSVGTAIPTEPATEPATQPTPEPVSITVYHGNENFDGLQTTVFSVEEKNMNVLVEKLKEVGVFPENIYIGSMKWDNGCLYLQMSPSFQDLIWQQGSSGEYIVMGSLVNTFLDAFGEELGVDRVYVSAGSADPIESVHAVYDFEMGYFN